jgi:Alpha-L-arabinofuranosidase B, catalytic
MARFGHIKPPGIPRIDWRHPLAQGLVFYGFDTGTGLLIDLAAGRPASFVGTKAGIAPSAFGAGILWNNSNTAYFLQDAAIEAATAAGDYTAACAILPTNTSGLAAGALPFGRLIGNFTSPYYDWAFDFSGGQIYGSLLNSATYANIGNPVTISNDQFASLALTAVAGTSAAFYGNGAQSGSISTGLAIASNNSAGSNIYLSGASSSSSIRPFIGFVYYGAFWKRALSAAEIAALHADPYAFLIFPSDRATDALRNSSSGTAVTVNTWSPGESLEAVRYGVAPYAGLRDIYGSAIGYWGLRAFSAAAAAAEVNAIQLQRASDGATQNITVLPNGSLNVAAAAAFLAGTTGGISIWYDQSGNGYNMVQATQAFQPQFTFSALGTRPAILFDGSSTFLEYSAGIPNVNTPATYSGFCEPQMTATNNVNYIPLDSVSGGWLGWEKDGFGNYNFTAFAYSQNAILSANNTWHSVQLVMNGGSSAVTLDGTTTSWSFTAGSPQIGGSNAIGCDIGGTSGPYTSYFKGYATELAAFAIAATTAQMDAAYANQNEAWSLGTLPAVPSHQLEVGTTARVDRGDPLESLGSAITVSEDSVAPIEFLVGVRDDLVLWNEFRSRFVRDQTVPVEDVAGLIRDAGAAAEDLGDQRTAAAAPIEAGGSSGASLVGDSALPVEWRGSQRADSAALVEMLGSVAIDRRAFLEMLTTARFDRNAAVENVSGQRADAGTPIESGGSAGILIIADSALPIEWSGTTVGDIPATIGILFSTQADLLAAIGTDETTPVAPLSVDQGRLIRTPGRIRLLRRN